MPEHPEDLIESFRALYPEIPGPEIPAAYECFRRYVQLAIQVARAPARTDLTGIIDGGTVSTGQVDPIRTFTNTG